MEGGDEAKDGEGEEETKIEGGGRMKRRAKRGGGGRGKGGFEECYVRARIRKLVEENEQTRGRRKEEKETTRKRGNRRTKTSERRREKGSGYARWAITVTSSPPEST